MHACLFCLLVLILKFIFQLSYSHTQLEQSLLQYQLECAAHTHTRTPLYKHTCTHPLSMCVHNRYRIHTCKYPLRRERKSFRKTMFIVKAIPRNFALFYSFSFFSLLLLLLFLLVIIVVVILATVIEFTYYNWLVVRNIVCVVPRGVFLFLFAFLFFNLKTTTIFHNTFLCSLATVEIYFCEYFPSFFLYILIFQIECATQNSHDADGDKLPNVRYYIPLYIYLYLYVDIYTYISI